MRNFNLDLIELVTYLISTRQSCKTVSCVVNVVCYFCYHIYTNISLSACCIFDATDDFNVNKDIFNNNKNKCLILSHKL